MLVSLFILNGSIVFGQSKYKVQGSVVGAENEPLAFATLVLLNANDSIMAQFGITDESGRFKLLDVKAGDYIAQFTFLGYQTLSKPVSVAGDVDFGAVTMEVQRVDLKGGEVSAEIIPVEIKGDTIQYNSAAFTTQPNAAVEDLLKQLPGMEVEKDGTVTAQGEEVQKVLVDGKEFFGDDPKMATKNLPADAIEKVEVFDAQSETSQFTGVDDGNRTKTINLVLKEGKKSGYFGNATGGIGYPDERFQGKFNVNRFTKKSQLSVLGMGNNINEQGFSFDDYVSFMGGFQNLMSSGVGSFEGGRPSASFSPSLGDGITTSYAGGLNLNYEFDKNTDLNASYFFNYLNNDLSRQSAREYFNNDFNFDTEESSTQEAQNFNHRLNFRLKHVLDTLQDIQIRGNITFNDGSTEVRSMQQTFRGTDIPANIFTTENLGDGQGYKIAPTLTYRRKFNKRGRSLVANLDLTLADDDRNTGLNSLNQFYINDTSFIGLTTDTIDQNQIYNEEQVKYGAELRYTEPLGKGKYLELRGSHADNNTNFQKDFFDVNAVTSEELFDSTLSSAYEFREVTDRAGLNFKISREKYNLTIGAAAQYSLLEGSILVADTTISKTFTNILPGARWDYRFTNSKRLRANYRTSINAPSLEQLQPVIDNSNPLQVYQGNPDLKQEYAHSLNLRYISFSQFTFISYFATLRATYTKDKITNSVITDSLFRQISQPVNVDEDLLLNGYFSLELPIRPLKIKTRIRPTSRYNRGILFVNGQENTSDQFVNGIDWRIDNRKKEKLDVRVGAKWTQTIATYSENSDLNQEFLTANYYTDVTVNFLKSWSLSTSFDYTIYSGEAFASNESIPLWKASVSKLFLKNQRGQLKLSVFDILNENRGFSRNSNLNYIEEDNTNTLSRYAMLTFTYSLSGLGKKESSGSHWRRSQGGRP